VAEKEREAAEKAKEAQAFTCKLCTDKYTDGSGSGSGSKKNYGFCSSKCRAANVVVSTGLARGLCSRPLCSTTPSEVATPLLSGLKRRDGSRTAGYVTALH
jgi:hypothetical protein